MRRAPQWRVRYMRLGFDFSASTVRAKWESHTGTCAFSKCILTVGRRAQRTPLASDARIYREPRSTEWHFVSAIVKVIFERMLSDARMAVETVGMMVMFAYPTLVTPEERGTTGPVCTVTGVRLVRRPAYHPRARDPRQRERGMSRFGAIVAPFCTSPTHRTVAQLVLRMWLSRLGIDEGNAQTWRVVAAPLLALAQE